MIARVQSASVHCVCRNKYENILIAITMGSEHNPHEVPIEDDDKFLRCAPASSQHIKIYFFFFRYNELRRVWNIHRRGVSSSKIKKNLTKKRKSSLCACITRILHSTADSAFNFQMWFLFKNNFFSVHRPHSLYSWACECASTRVIIHTVKNKQNEEKVEKNKYLRISAKPTPSDAWKTVEMNGYLVADASW